jgi:hypothetical protein
MRMLSLLATLMLVGCPRHAPSRLEEDKSIVFPEFYAQFPVAVGKPGQVYELDGVTLKALMIALTDRYPPEAQARSCWNRPESQEYRIIRQGDIIFVSLGPDPAACSPSMILFDSGVEYAISVDGRILRRRFDGEPNGPLEPLDAGAQESFAEPVPYNMIGVGSAEPVGPLPPFLRRDGGVRPNAGQPDGGPVDGGTSAGLSK